MHLSLVEDGVLVFIEGNPAESYLVFPADIDRLIEACFAEGVQAVLLYAANMTPAFFDLSSGEAGAILQKLRNYHIRLALVIPPDSVVISSRFPELVADERRGGYFGLFDTREAAIDWLREHAGEPVR